MLLLHRRYFVRELESDSSEGVAHIVQHDARKAFRNKPLEFRIQRFELAISLTFLPRFPELYRNLLFTDFTFGKNILGPTFLDSLSKKCRGRVGRLHNDRGMRKPSVQGRKP